MTVFIIQIGIFFIIIITLHHKTIDIYIYIYIHVQNYIQTVVNWWWVELDKFVWKM